MRTLKPICLFSRCKCQAITTTYCCWLMFLKIFVVCGSTIMNYITPDRINTCLLKSVFAAVQHMCLTGMRKVIILTILSYPKDTRKEHSYIRHTDSTNMYITTMTQLLPFSGFHWFQRNEIHTIYVHALREHDGTSYILERDLLYPRHLQELHSDYLLASKEPTVIDNMLSPYRYRMKLLEDLFCSSGGKVEKPTTLLDDKNNYIVYQTTLKLYLKLVMQLKIVLCVLSFNQYAQLKPFIEFNTIRL